jgi:hypothetical protein
MAVLKSPKKVKNKYKWVQNFATKSQKNLLNIPDLKTNKHVIKNSFLVQKKHTNIEIQLESYYIYNS